MKTHYLVESTAEISCTAEVASLLANNHTTVVQDVTCTVCIEARITVLQQKGTLVLTSDEQFDLGLLIKRRRLMQTYPSMIAR